MNVSYKWLKNYINFSLSPQEISDLITNTGLEVDELIEFSTNSNSMEGLVIGKVLTTQKHPNANKLKICKVDVGTEELQIICGADNVKTGIKVVVATVGTILTDDKNESFKIKKSKIRGELSQGMICSEEEIGVGDDNEGIMILPDEAEIGTNFKDFLDIYNDYVFDIAITPNRGDAISHIGVARDISAVLKKELIYPPIKFDESNIKKEKQVEIIIEDKELCSRYSGIVISGVKVAPSPKWLQNFLLAIGQQPINNIVDITNFVMLEIGQPLHAFDLKQIKGNKIVVKKSNKGEEFVTLDKNKHELRGAELMINDAERAIAIAGIMGGLDSGIEDETTDIFIESAFFDPISIRKTSKYLQIMTDASYRFERKVDANITVWAVKRAVDLITEYAGGYASSQIYDLMTQKQTLERVKLEISFDYINKIVGNDIDKNEVVDILKFLEFKILKKTETAINLEIPSFRGDVLRKIDVVEEILRIYSYNKIQFGTQMKTVISEKENNTFEKLKLRISDYLTSNTFFEIMANSFVSSDYAQMVKLPQDHKAVTVLNALNINLETLRTSLIVSGMEAISYNKKRQEHNLKFFEIGKIYSQKDDKYYETNILSIWLTGNIIGENWAVKSNPVDFFLAKSYVYNILDLADVKNFKIKQKSNDIFEYYLEGMKDDKKIFEVGLLNKKTRKKFDIEDEVFFASLNYDVIVDFKRQKSMKVEPISKFPSINRDLSLVLDNKISFAQIKDSIFGLKNDLVKDVSIFDVYQGENIGLNKKSYAIRIKFQDADKTLKDKQIDKIISKIITKLEQELGSELRK